MNKQDKNLKENPEITVTESLPKKEWNAPDINVIAPVNRTAGGPNNMFIMIENAFYFS